MAHSSQQAIDLTSDNEDDAPAPDGRGSASTPFVVHDGAAPAGRGGGRGGARSHSGGGRTGGELGGLGGFGDATARAENDMALQQMAAKGLLKTANAPARNRLGAAVRSLLVVKEVH